MLRLSFSNIDGYANKNREEEIKRKKLLSDTIRGKLI